MAKKRNSKSEKVRAYLSENPGAPVAEVAKSFGVSKALVYNARSGLKQGGRKKAARGTHAKLSQVSSNGVPATGQAPEQLVLAAQLIKACGSVPEAERTLRTAGLVASTLQ